MKKDLLTGALLVGEVVLAAGAAAALNTAKTNSVRGTYAVAVKADGTGGVDLDLAAGIALLLVSAIAPDALAPHVAAVGAGALACYTAREGAQLGAQHAAQSQQMGTTSAAVAGSLSQYFPNGQRGLPVAHVNADMFAQQFAGVR